PGSPAALHLQAGQCVRLPAFHCLFQKRKRGSEPATLRRPLPRCRSLHQIGDRSGVGTHYDLSCRILKGEKWPALRSCGPLNSNSCSTSRSVLTEHNAARSRRGDLIARLWSAARGGAKPPGRISTYFPFSLPATFLPKDLSE